MSVVYAVDTANIMMPNGQMVLIRRGEPRSSEEEVVRFKPFLFSTDAELYSDRPPTSVGVDGMPVEAATANPGERRSVRRG